MSESSQNAGRNHPESAFGFAGIPTILRPRSDGLASAACHHSKRRRHLVGKRANHGCAVTIRAGPFYFDGMRLLSQVVTYDERKGSYGSGAR